MILASLFITALLQVFILALIPFLYYLIRQRRTGGFFKYVGLYLPERRPAMIAVTFSLLVLLLNLGIIMSFGLGYLLTAEGTVGGNIRKLDSVTAQVVSILVIALVQTSLSEEIWFRGFIGKGLIRKLGFVKGSAIQAVLFGLLHGFLFYAITQNLWLLLAITVASSVVGFSIAAINERIGNGSIIPGWLSHGLGNVFAYSIAVFYL
ncbi:CPBP family intramembrane glutamic endopeptidase [Paenibacillus thermotolerans]|uniref:CPBP family intramembrane glutamic endopeptidase n=1 Tax=Paenibacillus thermotolerans TaxID=3027807 RepID=UPI002368C9B2|nr:MULTISPECIES: CPBP family intramembrane glutamic endopeptidase [unclassified Paenibacillus]